MPAHADDGETGAGEQADAVVRDDAGDVNEPAGVSAWASPGRIGAAIGIGSAAIVAAMLYTRYNRRETNDRGAARRGQGSDKEA